MVGFLFGRESWVRGAGTGVAARLPERLRGLLFNRPASRLEAEGSTGKAVAFE